MLESIGNQAFQYKRLSHDEMTKRGILGRLFGPIADTINPTRNGRKYSADLWEKVFENPIMKEKIANRCVFGEIGHPTDRTETDPEKIAICLAEEPKKGKDGKIWGVFDILDTPNGRILKAMCDYGCKIGVSSRGEGDVIEDIDGNEAVDPDTYSCECWDAVLLPAVKEARMNFVTEALDNKRYNKTLKQKLIEELDKASIKDRKVMEDTLNELDIKLNEAEQEKTLEDVFRYTTEHNGGTFNIKTFEPVEPKDGFSVGIGVATEIVENTKDIEAFKQACEDIMSKTVEDDTNVYLGTWLNPKRNIFEIDLSKIVPTEEEALEVASDREKAIWSFEASEAIDNPNYKAKIEENLLNESDELKNELWYQNLEAYNNSLEEGDNITVTADLLAALEGALDHIKLEEECNSEDCADKKECQENIAVVDNEAGLVDELKEALKAKENSEAKLLDLQNKLAVGDTKVKELEESLARYKDMVVSLSDKAKETKKLTEQVSVLQGEIQIRDNKIKRLNEAVDVVKSTKQKLQESITTNSNKDEEIKKLNESISNLKASSDKQLAEVKKQLAYSNKLIEAYKKAANDTMHNYILSKAKMLGVTENEIRNRLPESYDVKDVNKICEDLKSYQVNLNKLPFNIGSTNKVKFSPSKNDNLRIENPADEIDDELLEMAKLKF